METELQIPALSASQALVKRSLDLVISCLGLLLGGWFILIAAAIAAISCRAGGFFRQARVGRNGKTFRLIKIRTMSPGAEADGTITIDGDCRVTPFGRLLRKLKLDELPQLWNVLLGDMSLVGPRPDVPGYADQLSGEDRCILKVRPGITGPASLCFRNEEELLAAAPDPVQFNDCVLYPAKIRINVQYVREWSFWRDVGYLVVTVFPFADRWLRLIPEVALTPGAHPSNARQSNESSK